MYKLSIDLDRKLEIMVKHGLNAEEWLFIELIWLATEGQPEYMLKYFNDCCKMGPPKDTLQKLKDKKVFATSYKLPKEGENFDPDQVEFSKSFINNYFKLSYEAGEELFNAYPPYIQNTDMLLCANNITKGGYSDWNDFFAAYSKAIQHKVENHYKVMEILEWAKEQKLITFGIVEYVTTRKWTTHQQVRESGELGKHAIKVSTMEDVD